MKNSISRRALLRWSALGGLGLAVTSGRAGVAGFQADGDRLDELTIDLPREPDSLDPAIVYEVNGWSVVHSIYDSLVQYGPHGQLEPLLAESLTQVDPLTWEFVLRQGITFHNGEPFDARSVSFSIAHIVDPDTASQVAQNFQVIEEVEEVDPHTVRLMLSEPAPWLPAQIAAWLAVLPPEYASDPANDFGANPVGTGPYRFGEWSRGSALTLEANPDYFEGSPKGQPLAERVTYRSVPEASTRVADLLAGNAHIISAVPVDQVEPVESGGATVIAQATSGAAWVRIATDVEPFSEVRVRQALNYAVDVEAIIQALLGGNGERVASFFPDERGLGYDPSLAPYPYDPERARELLTEAGYPDGFETTLEHTIAERQEIAAAVAGQLEQVGLRVTLQPTETATFNETWTDPEAPPLRFATWRPMFDPYTLLSLIVANTGFLSRYDNPEAQALIEAGAAETDPDERAQVYQELGRVLHEEPAAIYLYSLTALYGVSDEVTGWAPRPDEYLIPTTAVAR